MTIRTTLLGTAAAASLIGATAHAQNVNDEIIVTATKRQQTLQEVPVAVTVTPADVIEKAQILDINDLQSVVPSLRVSQNQNSVQTTFSIRGFGNGGNNVGIEPSVGVFIDGVYRSRAGAQIGNLPKLERVEVLRGPQSTLFGKNSSAGVISIVTAEPSFESEGYIEAGIANYGGVNGRAYISGPISENVAGSIGGGFQNRDGYAESVVEGVPDSNDRDRFNLRGQLLFEPTEAVTFRAIADYSQLDEICCHVTNFINGPTAPIIGALGGQLADDDDPFAYLDFSDQPKLNEVEDYGVSFQADVAVSDNIDVVSISSYRRNDNFYDSEVDYTSASIVDSQSFTNEINTFTQELRVQGSEDRFDWLVGGYLFYEDIDSRSSLGIGSDFRPYLDTLLGAASGGQLNFAAVEAGLQLEAGSLLQDGSQVREQYEADNTSYSLFANVDFDITDRLTLTLGGSYIDDAKNVRLAQVENYAFNGFDFAGAEGAQILTAQGVQQNLPGAFLQTFGLPFTPENVALVGPANFGAFQQGLLAQVQAGVGQLNLTDPAQNPLLGLSALQFLPPVVDFPNNAFDGKSRDDEFTYTIRGAFDVSDDINVYAAYSTGFKATSFNISRDSRPTLAEFQTLDAAGRLPDQTAVTLTRAALAAGADTGPYIGTRLAGPEEAEVIEAGIKGRLDGLGNFSLTAFQQEIDGFQANVFQGAGFVLTNAGLQRTRGLEGEITLFPYDGLTLGLSGTYLDAEYVDFEGAPGLFGAFDASGDTVDGISPYSFVAAAQYDFDVSENLEGFVRTDFSYESETDVALNTPGDEGQNDVENFPGLGLVPLTRETKQWNAAAGFGFENGISVEAWVRNILDDEDIQQAFPGVIQDGTFNGYPNQPRTYGVNLRYDF